MDGAQAVVETPRVERAGALWVVVRHVAGWTLIVLGLAGLVVPILPGFLFILPGLGLIAPEIPWAQRAIDWVKARFRRG